VVFIGATIFDHKIRAFDSHDGKLLWESELPFSGVATPATYMVDGKQYVVIAASSARDPKSPQGGAYVALRCRNRATKAWVADLPSGRLPARPRAAFGQACREFLHLVRALLRCATGPPLGLRPKA